METRKRGSLHWRVVIICFLLVFVAMSIVSVYLLRSMETSQMNSLQDNIEQTVSLSGLLGKLNVYSSLDENPEDIQTMLDAAWPSGLNADISIVSDKMKVVASSNSYLVSSNASEVFEGDAIINSLMSGKKVIADGNSEDIKLRVFCYPVIQSSGGNAIGVVYVRADISSIDANLAQNRAIFIRAIVVALLLTSVLSFVLARSITQPIKNVTTTVRKLAKGEATANVEVKSDDEIGELATIFNGLKGELDKTMLEMSNEKNKLETILQYMADGLIAIDLDGKLIHINPAAIKMLGIPEDIDMALVDYSQLFGGVFRELSIENLKKDCEEGAGQKVFELSGRIFAIRYDFFKDEFGEDVGIIIIIQDITQRQKFEDMQTEFVANVSHELKTPLTNIKGYTETLLDGAIDDGDTAKKFLGIIDSESDRMNRLVRDLLQLSRMDNKQDVFNPKEMNIIILIDAIVTKCEIGAKQKGQQLNRLYNPDEIVRVSVDRDRFEQVITNILSNAIKYTQEGGRIDVDVVANDANARIIIQDNGMGISAEALPRIFDRFYRVDKARSRAMGGTGLGLAISKQIVEEHGGAIEAESQEGKGTKISVVLPLVIRKGIRNIE